jgi:ankyrin repeat protein
MGINIYSILSIDVYIDLESLWMFLTWRSGQKMLNLNKKKSYRIEKISKYNLLNKICIQLVQNLVTIELPDNDGLTKLSFDVLNIQQNCHYPEVEE